MKARNRFDGGGDTDLQKNPQYKKLKKAVTVAENTRDNAVILNAQPAKVSSNKGTGAAGTGKNVPLFQARKELKDFLKENTSTLKNRKKYLPSGELDNKK
jgi:hypothetical protein